MQHRGGMDGIGHSEGKSLDEGEKREWDWMGWYLEAGWGEVVIIPTGGEESAR